MSAVPGVLDDRLENNSEKEVGQLKDLAALSLTWI